jgi:hypothetical protein
MDFLIKNKHKLFAVVLFGVIIAVGCQTQTLNTQSQIAPVSTTQSATFTTEPQKTITKVTEIQPSITLEISKSPTSECTQPSQKTIRALSELMIAWEDVYAQEDTSGSYSNIRAFFEHRVHYIVDRSLELQHRCPLECTKQVWYTEPIVDIGLDGKEFTTFHKTIIITMLSEDEYKARSTAKSMFSDFSNYMVEVLSQSNYSHYFEKLPSPVENTRIGMANSLYGLPGYHIILTTSKGPISILVISYIPPWSDDFTTDLDLAVEFAKVQLFILEQAGVVH